MKGWGTARWWERSWWLWWGDARRWVEPKREWSTLLALSCPRYYAGKSLSDLRKCVSCLCPAWLVKDGNQTQWSDLRNSILQLASLTYLATCPVNYTVSLSLCLSLSGRFAIHIFVIRTGPTQSSALGGKTSYKSRISHPLTPGHCCYYRYIYKASCARPG